jgi:RNA polymerase sigma-70 factor (ECF subfamily)
MMDSSTVDPETSTFRETDDLMARARAGDQAAWNELVNTCYPKVRRVVRRRLNGPLRSLYDSTDFANSVLGSLAVKFSDFDFKSMEKLLAFLAQAAEQKIVDEYRRRHTLKRDVDRERRIEGAEDGGFEPRAADPTPSQVVQASEGYERLVSGLSTSEREVIELRRDGYSNEEIAAKTGLNVRKVQRLLKHLHDSWESSRRGT